MAFPCPHCGSRLQRATCAGGIHWICGGCNGRAVSLSVLRRTVGEGSVQPLWRAARGLPRAGGRHCPMCAGEMVEVPHGPPDQRLDVCRLCQFVWFDPGEFVRTPARPSALEPVSDPSAPTPAHIRLEILRARQAPTAAPDAEPASGWQWVPGILGLPVEGGGEGWRRQPWVTWILSAIVLAVSLSAMPDLNEWIAHFGFIPAEPMRRGGLTLVTAFFLHAGVWHLASNLYFLLVFGDDVEDLLGRWRYLGLIGAATVAGHLVHALGTPGATVPAVGASGGISGIVVFYALQFPRARLGVLLRVGVFPIRWLSFSARTGLIVWIVAQMGTALLQLGGVGRVSGLAHLGGAAAGAAFWRQLQRRA